MAGEEHVGSSPIAEAHNRNGEIGWISDSGYVLALGWIKDFARVECVSVAGRDATFGGIFRQDVVDAIGLERNAVAGYWIVGKVADLPPGHLSTRMSLRGGGAVSVLHPVVAVPDSVLLKTVLEVCATADFREANSNSDASIFNSHLGLWIQSLWHATLAEAGKQNEHTVFGPAHRSSAKVSIVTCLYGDTSWISTQQASFASDPSQESAEFIYVLNSPELMTDAGRRARIAAHSYGARIHLVEMKGNSGFGHACNVGAEVAASDRLLFLNPDCMPLYGDAWLTNHLAQLETLPTEQTRVVGAPLLYADGALMHNGMHIERRPRPEGGMLRAVHYGKGFPAAAAVSRPAKVPAVSGALISVARDVFESVGGFDTAFVYGHYEDADLCLRIQESGVDLYLLPGPMIHLEGSGSGRETAARGALALNQWHFTRRWDDARLARLHSFSDDKVIALGVLK